MSKPSNLSKEENAKWDKAMSMPIKKGTILNHVSGEKIEVLEDTTAHGSPLCRYIEQKCQHCGKHPERITTIYEHANLVKTL